MSDVLVVFASMTDANKIKFYIEKKCNITLKLVQTPKAISKDGCSYSLLVKRGDLGRISDAMRAMNVTSGGVYRATDLSKVR